MWTHLRVGDSWFFPIIIGMVTSVGLALRHPAISRLALGHPLSMLPTDNLAQR